MDRKPVSSSNIESIGHDPDTDTLEIEFKGGGVHQYDGVSAKDHHALVNAASIGKHFHAHVRSKFPSRKVS